jgi:bacterial/archaeal transporter family-2 protein
MKQMLPYILAILAGIFTTLESFINAKLGKIVTPKIATFHSLLVGSLVMLIAIIINSNIRLYTKVFNVKAVLSIGGIFGALIIYFVTIAIPKLGITTTLTLVIVSQVLSSLYIDILVLKNGLPGSQILGVILALAGVYFIVK